MDEEVMENRTIVLPQRYPYRPTKWGCMVGALGMGVGMGLIAFNAERLFGWVIGWVFCAIFLLYSALIVIHHFVGKRYVELGEDAMLIPSGFLHRRFVRIPYAMIDWVQANERCLHIRAEQPEAEIPSMCLHEKDITAIRDFLLPLASKNMEQRRQQILTHPEIDRRQVDNRSEKKFNERPKSTIQLPDRDAFIAFWKDDETFKWRKLVPKGLYVGGMVVYARLVNLVDPGGRFWLPVVIFIAYVFLAPIITWRMYMKKYGRFIKCYHCGDYFARDLSGASPYSATIPNPRREIIAQTGHCVKCGTRILANNTLERGKETN